jgi:hypothetical protein
MNRTCYLPLAALALLGTAPMARAGEMNAEMDGLNNIRLLDTHFSRYGYQFLKTIRLQDKGIEFRLPGEVKDIGQTGLYSYVALAGDFEIDASFEFDDVPIAIDGYGMSCGIAVDTNGKPGNLQLARVYQQKGRSGFNVVRGIPNDEGKMDYKEVKFEKSKARIGGLALRREKDEIVCLVAEGQGELKEIHREPFNNKDTIRTFRIYADPGGSPTPLHVWMGQLRVRAEEITGGFPKLERPPEPSWWPWILAFVLVTGTVAVVRRLRRKKEQPVSSMQRKVGRASASGPSKRR